jgi:predicted lipoprotein
MNGATAMRFILFDKAAHLLPTKLKIKTCQLAINVFSSYNLD